jgi:hypothetical protein
LAEDVSKDMQSEKKSENLLSRREAIKKAGKLAYAAPVLTVISLKSEAGVIVPPSPPDGSPPFTAQ